MLGAYVFFAEKECNDVMRTFFLCAGAVHTNKPVQIAVENRGSIPITNHDKTY